MSLSIVVLVTRVCGQHANLLWELFESGHLLGRIGEDQLLLQHGLGIAGHIELFIQDFNSQGKLGGLLIKLTEVSDLLSHPLVVKVFDFMLQMHEVAVGPKEEGAEPGREQLNGVFFAMPNHVSLCIQVDNMRGLIRALALVITSNSAVFQPLDPFGGPVDSIAEGNVKVGHSPVVLDVAIRGSFELIFIVFNAIVEPSDLFFKALLLAGGMGLMLGNGREEPISNGSEDCCVKVRVGCQGGCNGTGRHRWFRTLDQSDWERDAVLGKQDI